MTALPSDRRRLADLCAWPILIALLARLGTIVVVLTRHQGSEPVRPFWTADTGRYLELAASLLRGEFRTASGPEVYRLPGYPLFLSPGVALGWPTAYALVAQSLLCCLLVVVVVRSARLIGLSDRAALAAGFLCAVEPTLLLWSLQLMADAPLGAVVATSLWAFLAYLNDGSRRTLALSTALAAASALVKPVAFGLTFLVALTASATERKKGAGGALRLLLAAAIPGALVIGGWSARNFAAAGFAGFSTQISHVNRSADFSAWRSENPRLNPRDVNLERRRRNLNQPTATDQPLEVHASLASRLRLHLRGVGRTLSNPGVLTWTQFLDLEPQGMEATMDLFKNGPWAFLLKSFSDRPHMILGTVFLGGLNLMYWGLFAVGFGVVRNRSVKAAWATVMLVTYFALASGGPWGQSRFRIPFVSAICILGGAAFDRGRRQDAAPPPLLRSSP